MRQLVLAVTLMVHCVAGVAEGRVTQADKAKVNDFRQVNDYGPIELFTDVLSIMKKSYVSDVATSQYINAALTGLEKICGETYPKPALGEKTPKSEKSDYEYNELFTDALAICKRNHPEISLQTITYSAITSMIASVDPDGSFMSPEFYNELKSESNKSLGSAGIEISKRHGLISVITPIDNSPAFKAGIRKGDQIQRIDDRFTKDLNLSEAVKLLRGTVGSTVTLTIMRKGFEQPQEFSLVREVIQIKSVDSKTLDKGFGYIRITRFTEKTYDNLRAVLDTLREENSGNLRGLVLDLRNNPGGLLDQAIKVAEHFLEPGKVIAYTEGREKTSNMKFTARNGDKESHILIVVLVNDGSAAGSEIVAGALQDNKRALIMGTKSFGRDSLQTIIPLSDKSGLRLTTARCFSPKMKSFSPNGVTPDIIDSGLDEKLIENALILLKRQNEAKLR